MAFRSLASLYRFICVLYLVQIALNIWTMYEFGFRTTGESQLMLMLPALSGILWLYCLAVFARRTDHHLSRVYEHYQKLAVLPFLLFFAVVFALLFLFARGRETVLSPCAAENFMTAHCALLVFDMVLLPAAIFAALFYSMSRIATRARAIHGVEMVPLPPPSPPPPPPVKLVPAWALANVSEIDTAAGTEGGSDYVVLV
ncbi:hypothetical protein C8R44DRAFT_785904 [Mycena epipterygia]|nr:hypothetical protein C8R44DRAFT_785904 [Mycena epipterygia]